MKQVFKLCSVFFLLISGVVLFKYLGTEKIDFVLIGLVSVLIALLIFIFYESAIRQNKRLFFILVVLDIIFFSLFLYKKIIVGKDKKLVRELIESTQNLKREVFDLTRMKIDVDSVKKDVDLKDIEDKIKSANSRIDSIIGGIENSKNSFVGLLSEIQFNTITGSQKLKIERSIREYKDMEESVGKMKESVKKDVDDLKKEIDNRKKVKDEVKSVGSK